MAFTVDVLGEATHSDAQADRYAETYLDLINSLSKAAPHWPDEPLLDTCRDGRMPRVNASIKLTSLDPYFDAVTTSEEARSCKPHPGIYRHALAKAGGVAPEEVVFVGDSLDYDVVGANALGMTSVLIIEPPDRVEGGEDPDYVIETMPELLQIVSA